MLNGDSKTAWHFNHVEKVEALAERIREKLRERVNVLLREWNSRRNAMKNSSPD